MTRLFIYKNKTLFFNFGEFLIFFYVFYFLIYEINHHNLL